MVLDLVEIVHDLRTQLGRNGGATLSTLTRAFHINDVDKSGTFNFPDFVDILGKVGLFAPRQSLSKLYRYFDKNLEEKLDFREFLQALRGDISPRREQIIRLVWDKLACGCECIPTKLVIGAYSAASDPRVLAGDKTEAEVFRDFVTNFENAGDLQGQISWDAFFGYYACISASIPYSDDYFVKQLELAWGVRENTTKAAVPTALVRKVENVLREKVRQRAKQDGNEFEGLRLTLKHFDLEGSGLIDYKAFLAALERFGIALSPEVAQGLYADFEQENGKINYAEFVSALYHGEQLVSAYTGKGGPGLEVVPVLGGPCSGTSAVCAAIKSAFGFVYLNAEALVDAEALKPNSELGKEIHSYQSLRKAVPASLTVDVLINTIRLYASEGKTSFVLDNFPASLEDYDAWQEAAERAGVDTPMALHLEIPESLMVQRLVIKDPARRTVDAKIKAYNGQTLPLVATLDKENRVVSIDAEAQQERVNRQALDVVQSLRR